MPRPLILCVLCGQPPEEIARVHGGYGDWFRAGLGERVLMETWDVRGTEPQPPLEQFAGVLLTGSPASLTEPEPWMEVAVETIREAAETEVPLLGVCFGHQLVGCAYGAPTILAPDGGEHGSLLIELNEAGRADPLLRGCPDTFRVQFSHYDQVDAQAVAYSNGLRVLASSSNTAVQVLAGGKYIRSVQFHPEFSTDIMSSYLRAEDSDSPKAQPCPMSSRIFENWLDAWVFAA